MKKKQFFVNFITIVMFGAIGTLVSCSIIAFGTSHNSLIEVFTWCEVHISSIFDL